VHNKCVLYRHHLLANGQLAAGSHAPAARSKGLVEDAAVLDLGQVDDAVGLDLDVHGVEGRHEHGGHFGAEGGRREAVEGGGPVDAVLGLARLGRQGRGEGRGRRARVGRRGDGGREGGVDLVDGGTLDDGCLGVDVVRGQGGFPLDARDVLVGSVRVALGRRAACDGVRYFCFRVGLGLGHGGSMSDRAPYVCGEDRGGGEERRRGGVKARKT